MSKVVMDAAAIDRSLNRLAHEILERSPEGAALGFVGIHTRGVPLAERLAALIKKFDPSRRTLPAGQLDISFHRDDFERAKPAPKITEVPFDLDQEHVILVDDVLFTGRSVRAALNALVDIGRAKTVRLAVLVDRGHRQLPIRADYVGKNIPTAEDEEVTVRLSETDGIDEVSVSGGSL
ncbi:MAG: bifunctional pyr operon transcriptional regulator/uracil phosphoribosyltransferase PyrR [Verrucomicrobiales bacterium]|jgi:pyrimidine operon attenuation protein/uracil phosphoribosyltransferase|nr:bifunctional pyr operon transcriptional regulator/uracil phosphoribosyltransferase PyrR [Verrucomicrobiales bacterium]